MVLIFSEYSNVSSAVLSEVELAATERVHILNFRVDGCPLSNDLRFFLSAQHWLDAMTPPMAEHHARLVAAIRVLLSKPRPAKPATKVDEGTAPRGKTPEAIDRVEEDEAGVGGPSSNWRRRLALAGALVLLLTLGVAGFSIWKGRHPSVTSSLGVAVSTGAQPSSTAASRTPIEVKPGDSLQEKLENAQAGDTVHVAAGEYNEEKLTIRKPGIHLIGDGEDKTFVRLDGAQGAVLTVDNCPSGEIAGLCFEHTGARKMGADPVISLQGSKVTLHDCMVRHSRKDGIVMSGGDQSTVEHCDIEYCAYGSGIAVTGSGAHPVIVNNYAADNKNFGIFFGGGSGGLAEKNHCVRNEYGIFVQEELTNPTISDNPEISHNRQYGIVFVGGAAGLAKNNTCEDNGSGGLCVAGEKTAPILIGNSAMKNHGHGIMATTKAGGQIQGNTCDQNGFSGIAMFGAGTAPTLANNHCDNNSDYGIYVNQADPIGADAQNNEVSGNTKGPVFSEPPVAATASAPSPGGAAASPEASPRPTEVKPGGSIQEALENAKPGDTIHVEAGEYNDEQLTINKPNIHLVGDGQDRTFVRCDGAQGAALTVNGCESGEITGFCFEHTGARKRGDDALVELIDSNVTLHNCAMRHSRNDGILIRGAGQPIVDQCEVDYCDYGSGISIDGMKAAPVITNNHVTDSKDYGIFFYGGSAGTAGGNDCANNGYGIGVWGKTTAPTLKGNTLVKNTAAGILLFDQATGHVEDNICKQNRESGIAIDGKGTNPTLTGNHCLGNAQYGILINHQARPIGADALSNELTGNEMGPVFPGSTPAAIKRKA